MKHIHYPLLLGRVKTTIKLTWQWCHIHLIIWECCHLRVCSAETTHVTFITGPWSRLKLCLHAKLLFSLWNLLLENTRPLRCPYSLNTFKLRSSIRGLGACLCVLLGEEVLVYTETKQGTRGPVFIIPIKQTKNQSYINLWSMLSSGHSVFPATDLTPLNRNAYFSLWRCICRCIWPRLKMNAHIKYRLLLIRQEKQT